MINKYKWYRLDNAAKIYPSITNNSSTNIFRVSYVMKNEVEQDILQAALWDISKRFPTIFVKIKKGFFWNYFEANEEMPIVEKESCFMCSRILPRKNNGYLFRVLYFEKRISIEMFHGLCDGAGAVEFSKALIYRYLELKGYPQKSEGLVLTLDTNPSEHESEDSFAVNYTPVKQSRLKTKPAYKVRGTTFGLDIGMGIINGRMSTKKLLEIARKYDVTVSEYLGALLVWCVYRLDFKVQSSDKPIKLLMPVNLRKYYDSMTLRNFILYIYTEFMCSDKEWTFEEMLAEMKKQVREELKIENLQRTLNCNVSLENNNALKLVPLFIKQIGMKIGYRKLGNRLVTLVLSNLGNVKLPQSMNDHIDYLECALAVEKGSTHNVCLISHRDTMSITFARNIYETKLEKMFFRQLSQQGVEIVIESNLWEEHA